MSHTTSGDLCDRAKDAVGRGRTTGHITRTYYVVRCPSADPDVTRTAMARECRLHMPNEWVFLGLSMSESDRVYPPRTTHMMRLMNASK